MDPSHYSDISQIKVPYDVVSLPSQGIFYVNKVKEVKITYLNASDENLLSSPSIVKSGNLIDGLLKRKVVGGELRVEEMLDCDKQALLIFLRNTAYGPSYEFTLTDPKTNTNFTHTHDLSNVKIKDFTLKADSNGEFDYIFPQTKKKIKFKFLNSQQENELTNLDEQYHNGQITPIATRRLELLIQEIEGERDLGKLSEMIQTMPIRDSQEFKKYVWNNQPGLDLSVTVKAPSGEDITTSVVFGAHFFRSFFGV
jgi:hypothetical protein